MEISDKSLIDMLTEGLSRKRLSQSRLATITGVSQGYISALLAGKKSAPSEIVLARISSALDIPLIELTRAAGKDYRCVTRPVMVGISGPSGAGKTFISKKISESLPDDVAHIELDGYYKTLKQIKEDDLDCGFDNPAALKFDEVIRDIVAVKSGQEINVPERDFLTHKDKAKKTLMPRPIIVAEGLLLFGNPVLLREFDVKIWVEASEDVLLERRIRRDTNERGRKVNDVLRQFSEEVRPGYDKYIRPLQKFADIIVVNEREIDKGTPVVVPMILSYIQNLPFARPLSKPVSIPPSPPTLAD